jgi:XTP/dITP diphosphohydrolase
MRRLLIATTNRDKLREIRRVLADAPVELVSLLDFPSVPEPDETGATFRENARLKARYYDVALTPFVGAGLETRPYTVAEDSGLVIDALDGEPGVRSARFLRPDASYPERFAEIYRRLAERPERPRAARFICALAVVHNGELTYGTTGEVGGTIAETPRGAGGFGYDPIFYYRGYGRTLAEVSEAEKLLVTHRGQAFRQLADWIRATESQRRPL